jgi:signal transduction histidine kinase
MAQPQLSPEMLVPRLGEYLVKRGHITESGLEKALVYQEEQLLAGRTCLLGQALLDLELLKRSTLDQAVTEQIIQLRSALQAANRNLERRVEERTAELQAAIERLSELNQMKANFVANVSHELRTPLTHIIGYLELMVSESLGSISTEQKHALEISQRAAGRLENLIDDLIMFSLSSRGQMTLKLQPVELDHLVNLAVRAASRKAEERNVTVHAVVDEGLPPVQADPQKIAWVLNQLLDNSIKFTPSQGRVVVSLRSESSTLLMLSVTDTGIGIPTERLQEIFEPFHQLDSSPTRHYGGTGLGLSLVRQIVEAHGSLLDVQSVEGRGTTFKFPLLALKATG